MAAPQPGQSGRGTTTSRPPATYWSTLRGQGHTMAIGGNTALDPLPSAATKLSAGGGPSRTGTGHPHRLWVTPPAQGCSISVAKGQGVSPRKSYRQHGPLGAYLEGFSRPRAEPGVTSGGELVNITPEDNHGHLTIHVGDVLVAIPFAGPNSGVVFSASNTSVLRPLSGGGLQEFRAVAPGTAELSVPATVCRPTFPPRTCPFDVMVTVS